MNNSNDWYQCLRLIHNQNPQQTSGYCLTQAEIQFNSNHIGTISKTGNSLWNNLDISHIDVELNQSTAHDCCQNLSQRNYCFLYHSKQYPDLVIPIVLHFFQSPLLSLEWCMYGSTYGHQTSQLFTQ